MTCFDNDHYIAFAYRSCARSLRAVCVHFVVGRFAGVVDPLCGQFAGMLRAVYGALATIVEPLWGASERGRGKPSPRPLLLLQYHKLCNHKIDCSIDPQV